MMQMQNWMVRSFRNICVTLSAVGVLASPTFAKPVFDLVSLANDGSLPQYGNSGGESKITPDGRFVVFRSGETQLVTPPTSGYQIFLRDRQNGTTELISANDQGQYGVGSSEFPTISDDGCRVVFKSDASNLVANYGYRGSDVFVRDRCVSPMTTTLATLNYNGVQSNAASFTPSISGNGRFVAFNSYSTDLVLGIAQTDVLYLRDLQLQTTILLSASLTDGRGEQAWNPAVSYDGSRIAFTAASKNLVAGVVAGWNVFLYDANAFPHIRLVSSDANGVPQDAAASGDQPHPGISADGHYVSFYSDSRNLVPNDINNFADIFVKNVDTKEIWRANVSSTGTEANADTRFNSTLSKDGTWVAFWALASNLITGTSDISRLVVLHNIYTGETQRVLGLDPEYYPAISGDLYGRFVSNYWAEKLDARFNATGLFVYDRHQLPVAMAQVDASTAQPPQAGNIVKLDGSASHNNGNVNSTTNFFAPKAVPNLIYTWTQTEGNSVTFDDPHAVKPSFTAPLAGSYTFKLVVTDTVEASLPSIVTLNVGAAVANQKPIANAGPDQNLAGIGVQVTLNGSQSSDPDGGPSSLTYSWSQISGQSLLMNNGNTANPSFTPTVAGSYSFRLVVNDGKDSSTPDVVTIQVGQSTAAQVNIDLPAGWNLLGNGYEGGFDVAAVFGDPSQVATVWKWLSNATWAFYSPVLTAQELTTYAASKNYAILTRIEAGEGFWVNAKLPLTASLPSSTPILSSSFKSTGARPLGSHWSLMATGDNPTPPTFNAALSLTPPSAGVTPNNLTTMWAWRTANPSGWYFWAPSLAAGTLQNYLTTKGYLDFATMPGTTQGTLTPSTGFWVNMP